MLTADLGAQKKLSGLKEKRLGCEGYVFGQVAIENLIEVLTFNYVKNLVTIQITRAGNGSKQLFGSGTSYCKMYLLKSNRRSITVGFFYY